jgi:hypothetical protein
MHFLHQEQGNIELQLLQEPREDHLLEEPQLHPIEVSPVCQEHATPHEEDGNCHI